MGLPISRITLKGYKSIRSLDGFELRNINVLIGANGCGKSNFVGFFAFLREIVEERLQRTVELAGRSGVLLHFGSQKTQQIEAQMSFGSHSYQLTLNATDDERLIIDERISIYYDEQGAVKDEIVLVSDGRESILKKVSEADLKVNEANLNGPVSCKTAYGSVSHWTVYHVHDTSNSAPMRRSGSIYDIDRLRPDAGNLSAFLYHLREEHNSTYRLIVDTVKLVAPFFKDFRFHPERYKDDQLINLGWTQEGSDYPFRPFQLSDGTLRFVALATAVLQPNPPATILIDEPELGLHPDALGILANLILQARFRTQVIVSTQSATLVNYFEPHHIVVVERVDGATTLKRLEDKALSEWLEEYTLGELWQKNVYGGGPVHE